MKSVFPSIQKVLQGIHLGLGLPQTPSAIKERFVNTNMTQGGMSEYMLALLNEIFTELDADEESQKAYIENLLRFSSGYTELFSKVWVYNSTQKNVVWHLLGYFFAPSIARHMAFWHLNICADLDKGMPRERFWYLPEFVYPRKKGEVYLPVEQVIDWICDLISGTASDIAEAYDKSCSDEKKTEDINNVSRKLNQWRNGVLPNSKDIKEIFNDGVKFDFKGAFLIDENILLDEKFHKARSFILSKNISDEEIFLQIGMHIPDENASIEIKEDFVSYVVERYKMPSNKTIRTRLLYARMIQNAYISLLKYLFPDVDKRNVNLECNKLLQVFEIYKRIYNLTISAWNACGEISDRNTEIEENLYFEKELFASPFGAFGIDARTLYEVILPSNMYRNESISKCVNVLNYMINKDNELSNLILLSPHDLSHKVEYINHSRSIECEYDEFSIGMKSGEEFNSVLANINEFDLVYKLYFNSHRDDFKMAALDRMGKMNRDELQDVFFYISYLDYLLRFKKNSMKGIDRKYRVDEILSKIKFCDEYVRFTPVFQWFEAKHQLNMGYFDESIELYKKAKEGFDNIHCGKIKGEIIRELFSIELYLHPTKINQNNYERDYRDCLDYGLFTKYDNLKDFNDFVDHCKKYFADNLYRPYYKM